ncbi:MAG: transposase, partial [Burkholderiales bacterium]|nr:transposase [Burkholderiales bacterium]
IRVKQRALMDLVSKIVNKLAGTFAVKKNDRRQALSSGNPLENSCAFFLNNEKSLRTFLQKGNYLVEPDNNVIERSIRPLAVIRNASHFWNSPEYAEATLARLTVFRTLELNGIDPLAWCQKLCGAVYDHIASKLMDYNWRDTGELTTKVGIRAEAKPGETDKLPEGLRQYRLSELIKDFPFSEWVMEALFGDDAGKYPQLQEPEAKIQNS